MYSVWLDADQQRLWRAHLAMGERLRTAMHRQLQEACGLTLADYDVLVALSERGSMRVNELGEALAWEQSRLSHQLRRMRDRGLVERQDSTDDRRGAFVTLTEAGREHLRTAAPSHAELVRSVVFEGMTADEVRALTAWTSRVLHRLGG
ncbi:MarR family transcriptional regulator [Mycobacterium sp. ACS4331]|uniref:MarR family winged helix-turn-helix transcriptional regulator n=1 Tax=Mycobacterium sp. ACS4331 TaxID=1834121 RepID=UPI0007FD73D3|nr:MarR family transcriptional regulator [Mycobacterium sp. ACS4331]OBF15136.1 MarR family transcriptional regulator [Mycobacterium sp. ACS4331]